MIRLLRKCPLAVAIVITFIIADVAGAVLIAKGIIKPDVTFTHPLIASVFEYSQQELENRSSAPTGAPTQSFNVDNPGNEDTTEATGGDETDDAHADDPDYGKVVYVERASDAPRCEYYDEVNVKATTTKYDYSKVDKDYFADTLFIGDSRIEGLCRYGGIDAASYCFKSGVTVWDITEKSMFDKNFEKTTLVTALEEKQFEYVYIMMGINELGRGTPDTFAEQYMEMINFIRQYQPKATMVLMGIMNVTKEYSDGSDVYNNDNVNARNVAVSKLTNGKDIFYLDINDSVCDENGAMTAEYSRDGIHLKAEYYTLWADYICDYVVVKNVTGSGSISQDTQPDTSQAAADVTYMFIGDSRYVGMCQFAQDNDVFVAENARGYEFLEEKLSYIYENADESTILIIGLGVNDYAASYRKYISTVNKLADELPCRVCYMLVNPVEEEKEIPYGYTVYNEMIDEYNALMAAGFSESVHVIDTNTYLKETGYNTADGLHYDDETYKKIYNYLKSNAL